jgi:hypothetical protein
MQDICRGSVGPLERSSRRVDIEDHMNRFEFLSSRTIITITIVLGLFCQKIVSFAGNTTTNVDENIKKARRSSYGLFSSGFHGYNGLDVDTMLHLYKTYILPVLERICICASIGNIPDKI